MSRHVIACWRCAGLGGVVTGNGKGLFVPHRCGTCYGMRVVEVDTERSPSALATTREDGVRVFPPVDASAPIEGA